MGGVRRALLAKGLSHVQVDFKLLDESKPEKIVAQLVPEKFSSFFALITTSGHIAKALSSMNLQVPTIFLTIADPLMFGIVESLGTRNQNVAGVTYIADSEWKTIEVLILTFPMVRRIGILADQYYFDRPMIREVVSQSKDRLGVTILPFVAETRTQLENVFATSDVKIVDAWVVPETPVVFRNEARVMELVSRNRVPTILGHPSMLEKGAILTFGVDFPDMWGEIAQMVRIVCAGVPAKIIPIVRPHHVFLGVSTTNARRQGIKINPQIFRLSTFTH